MSGSETGLSKSSVRTATQLLKLRPYKTTTPCHRTIHFCSWFLQFVTEGKIDPQFLSDEVWSHLQGYINTQNNHYWISQNPHLTHEVLPHPVKVGVWCTVNARILVPAFFNETIAKDIYM
jgi:hypothetical protein